MSHTNSTTNLVVESPPITPPVHRAEGSTASIHTFFFTPHRLEEWGDYFHVTRPLVNGRSTSARRRRSGWPLIKLHEENWRKGEDWPPEEKEEGAREERQQHGDARSVLLTPPRTWAAWFVLLFIYLELGFYYCYRFAAVCGGLRRQNTVAFRADAER